MQLTTRWWRLTLTAVGAFVVLLAVQSYGSDRTYVFQSLTPEERAEFNRRMLVSTALRREALTYLREQLTAVLDSLDRASTTTRASAEQARQRSETLERPAPPAISVVALDSIGESARLALESLAMRELEGIPVVRIPVRIVVLTSPRTVLPRVVARDGGDASIARYVRLPSAPGESCTLLLTARPQDRDVLAATMANANGVLGPCAFYAAFGLPGRALRAHLDSAAWYPAAFARWRDTLDLVEPQREPWGDLSRDGVHCLVRADAICARGWMADARYEGDDEFLEPTVAVTPALPLGIPLPWFGVRGRAFGARQRVWLSDLVHEVGEERFGEFWRRDTTVDASFRQLTGVSEEAWTGRWLARSYTWYAASPRPSRAELGWWALVMFASLATLARVRERRAR